MNSGINSIIDKSVNAYVFNFTGNQNGQPVYSVIQYRNDLVFTDINNEEYQERIQICRTGVSEICFSPPCCSFINDEHINIKSGGALLSLNNLIFNTNSPLSIYFVHKWRNMKLGVNYYPFSIDCRHNNTLTQIAPRYSFNGFSPEGYGLISTSWGPNNQKININDYKVYEQFINKYQIDEWHINQGSQIFKSNNKSQTIDGGSTISNFTSGEIIGNTGTLNQNYIFGELLVFSGLLSDAEKSGVYTYLCDKWCVNIYSGFSNVAKTSIDVTRPGIGFSKNGFQSISSANPQGVWAEISFAKNGLALLQKGPSLNGRCWTSTVTPPVACENCTRSQNQVYIYFPTDPSNTFYPISTFPPNNDQSFKSVAISYNTGYLLAVTTSTICNSLDDVSIDGYKNVLEKVYVSTDLGQTWSFKFQFPPPYDYGYTPNRCKINHDGSVMAIIDKGFIYLSYDFGNNWTTVELPIPLQGADTLFMSCNGQHMVVSSHTNGNNPSNDIAISNNFGSTWIVRTLPTAIGPSNVTISNDGYYLCAGDLWGGFAGVGRLYHSVNGGSIWNPSQMFACYQDNFFADGSDGDPVEVNYNVARFFTDGDCSCDGQIQVFNPWNGTPFISYNFGTTFWEVQKWRFSANFNTQLIKDGGAWSIGMTKDGYSAELFADGECDGDPVNTTQPPSFDPSTTSSIFGAQSLSLLIGEDILEDLLNN